MKLYIATKLCSAGIPYSHAWIKINTIYNALHKVWRPNFMSNPADAFDLNRKEVLYQISCLWMPLACQCAAVSNQILFLLMSHGNAFNEIAYFSCLLPVCSHVLYRYNNDKTA